MGDKKEPVTTLKSLVRVEPFLNIDQNHILAISGALVEN